MKNTKIVLILLMASAYGHAQQQPNFLFFEQNMGLYNPAATGLKGVLQVLVIGLLGPE